MMNKRAYKKYTEVYEELVRYCRAALASGCRILPGERELAVQLETSRMTLRKALEEARLNGVIRQENRHTDFAGGIQPSPVRENPVHCNGISS